MASIRCFLTLVLAPIALVAQTVPNPKSPDRPAAPLAMYKDKWAPMVGVQSNSPIIIVNGCRVVLERDAAIILDIGKRYTGGFVTVADVNLVDSHGFDISTGSMALEANLTPSADIPEAYALAVANPSDLGPDKPPALVVVAQQVDNLKAGKKTPLYIELPRGIGEEHTSWYVLVFSAGQQVRSTGTEKILPEYFGRLDSYLLKGLIAEKAKKGVNSSLTPYRRTPIVLPDSIVAKYKNAVVKVEISVDADGRVNNVQPLEVADPELSSALTMKICTWLFIPAFKDGAAVPAKAIIPLKM